MFAVVPSGTQVYLPFLLVLIPSLGKGGSGRIFLSYSDIVKFALNYNNDLGNLARELRKNMTDAEKLPWSKLSRKQISGYQFYRQRIIGDYIVDFYCPITRLVIEIDGGQHYHGERQESDKMRNSHLASIGLTVLRFSNLDVLKNIDSVFENIYENLNPPESPFF